MLRYYNSPFKIVWEVCFDKCSKGALAEDEIKLRVDGTTNLKLEALPKIVSFVQFSKMTVTYSGDRPKLSVDRFAGTVNYSLGFTLDGDNNWENNNAERKCKQKHIWLLPSQKRMLYSELCDIIILSISL